MIDAQTAQRRAAAPGVSAWVAASAGTGKTKVLTDRLLSLMLDGGTEPSRLISCARTLLPLSAADCTRTRFLCRQKSFCL